MEAARQSNPEYKLGDRVAILEHVCLRGKLGLFGSVTELSYSGKPINAQCNTCHKSIMVDFKALESQALFKNGKK